jgi:hypothetical protein
VVLVETELTSPRSAGDVKAIDVSPLEPNLQDAVLRLIRLLDTPADARAPAPLDKREIIYRLLVGAQGGRLGCGRISGSHCAWNSLPKRLA